MARGYNFYAVARGFNPGVYRTWDEAQRQTSGFPGAIYQGFDSYDEAVAYVRDGGAWSRRGWESIRAEQGLASDPSVHADVQRLMARNVTYHAVAVGRETGIYMTWDEARLQVVNYPGAAYRSFNRYEEAVAYVNGGGASSHQA